MEVMEVLKTTEARLNFLKGLIRIAKCDQKIDDRELLYYQSAATSFELGDPEIEILRNCWNGNEKINVEFNSNKEKMFFFVQAIQLCWIDNEYVDIEKKEIADLAKELNISQTAINAVEDWVQEGMIWNRKGDNLLDLE